MEDKFKELLQIHRSKFASAIDVERLYPILQGSAVLIHSDLAEINEEPTQSDRVEKLLDILQTKTNLAFQSLCLALETTYPHLLTVMFLGGSQRGTPCEDSRSTSLTSDSEEDVIGQTSHSESRSQEVSDQKTYTRIIPSYKYDFDDSSFINPELKHAQGNKDGLSLNLHKVRLHLDRHKQPIMNGETRLGERLRDYDWLKSQCDHAMSELQSLKRQQADTVKRCDQAMKEGDISRQNSRMATEQLQKSRDEIQSLKTHSSELLTEKTRLEQEVSNLQNIHEEDKQELADLRKQQREVINENCSSDVVNKMYDSALDKYEAVKKDYDALRERYAELVATHSTAVSKLEHSSEENNRLRKQYDCVCIERDNAIMERNGLKQQCTAAIRNWDQVLHERNDLKEAFSKMTQQRDEFLKDNNQTLAMGLRAKKDLETVCLERDAALKEYALVMSERDAVHKEMDQLQEKLNESLKTMETFEKDKKAMQDEIETLKREIKSALQDRDKAFKERFDICEQYGNVMSKKEELEMERNEYRKDYELVTQERDVARKERHEALQDRDRILRENYEREKNQKERADEMDQVSKETESLRKQIEKLAQELRDAIQEAEIAKKRRDWAFGERDKIVQERDSIRAMSDNMRHERDRAVSDVLHALRDHDELKKQKTEACNELKEMRERYEALMEKEARKNQLNAVGHNHSRDSAIDADLQEWETETLEIDLVGLDPDSLGFELVGGKDDPQFPNDNSIFISHVSKGGAADGKLKVNDLILRVCNTDITNVEKRVAMQTLQNNTPMMHLVIRRRKAVAARTWQLVQLSVNVGKDLGIHIEDGLFVSRITASTAIGNVDMLTVGDRIVSVNGRCVENMSAKELMKLLEGCADSVVLDVWRQTTPVNSAGSSPTPVGLMIPEQPMITHPVTKIDNLPMWESANTDSTKNSSKNLKTSGSQTDSLDSPGPTRRHQKHEKDMDHKTNRHSAHVFEGAIKKVGHIFRPRHKSQERHFHEENPKVHQPMPERVPEDVVGEFDLPFRSPEMSGSNRHKVNRKRELEQETIASGTWPKCHRVNIDTPPTGTVFHPQQKRRERPSLGLNTFSRKLDSSIPISKVPPMPPERTDASFSAIRHSPQSSDSTIKYGPQSPVITSKSSKSTPYLINQHKMGPLSNDSSSSSEMSYRRKPISHNVRIPRHTSQLPNTANPLHFDFYGSRERPGPISRKNRPTSAPDKDKRTPPHNSHLFSSHLQREPHTPRPISLDIGPHYSHPRGASDASNTDPVISPSSFQFSPLGPPSHNLKSPVHPLRMPPQSAMVVKSQYVPTYTATSTRVGPSSHSTVSNHSLSPRYSSPPGTFSDYYMGRDIPGNRQPFMYSSDFSSPSPSQLSVNDRVATPTPIDMGAPGTIVHRTSPYGKTPVSSDMDTWTFPRKVTANRDRFRIPSSTSVSTTNKSGSVEIVSGRSSPVSPIIMDYPSLRTGATTPIPIVESLPRKKPRPGDTRQINIEKTSQPVGFQINVGHSGGGIFVSSVSENSLATQAGLEIGDQLLEVCGINMRGATYDHARSVLLQCGNNLTMLVQYNPHKYKENAESSGGSSANTSPTNSPDPNCKYPSQPVSGPTSPKRMGSISSAGSVEPPRYVTLKKNSPTSSLGVSLVGGNVTGVFVHEVQPDSVAFGHDGLHCGDQILEYNGIDLQSATAEQAGSEVSKPCSSCRIKVQYNPNKYNNVCKQSSESFHIRAHFDNKASCEGELSFRKDDILLVENTCTGTPAQWFAWLVDDEGKKMKCGLIPSQEKLDDDLAMKRSLSESLSLHDSEELKGSTRRGSGSARRSFFRRKRHQRNNSKDSRELNSFSDASLNSDSVPLLDDLSLYNYTKVEKMEYKKVRPVVMLAPLADALVKKLQAESPDKYAACNTSIMHTSAHEMEQSLSKGSFIDYWYQDDHYECIRVSTIVELCDNKIHCLLCVSPAAVERLHRLQIYPIVIFSRHKSHKQIREVRDVEFLPEKMSNKNARELFEHYQKLEQDYRHLFSAVIQGGNLAEMCMQVKTVIAGEQKKAIWVPVNSRH